MEDKVFHILVINPGSTSTKIAVFRNKENFLEEVIRHKAEEIAPFEKITDQFEFRKDIIENFLKDKGFDVKSLDAVMGRGGLMKPVEGGVYKVNDEMLNDLRSTERWGREHASNLGALIADSFSKELGIPAFICDPVVVDELTDVARVSGFSEIERKSILHALNIRSVARKLAGDLGKKLEDINLVGVHMGGGVSVVALEKGKLVDVSNALLGGGPFSPQRAGDLPIGDLIEIAYSGKYTKKELLAKLVKTGGLIDYLGTDNGIEICDKIQEGDKKYELIYKAMIYQVCKNIGAYSAVLKGDVQGIFLSGGLTYDNDYLVPWIKEHTAWIAPVFVYPGEEEMEALGHSAYRVLIKEEIAKDYK